MAILDRASRRLMRLLRASEVDVGMLALPRQSCAELTLDDGFVVMSLDGACLLRLQTIPAR